MLAEYSECKGGGGLRGLGQFGGFGPIGGRRGYGRGRGRSGSRGGRLSSLGSWGKTSYSSAFDINGLESNTYIYNNYFGGSESPFLANHLWYGKAKGNPSGKSRSWTSKDDANWRATTKSPFFENTIPGLI